MKRSVTGVLLRLYPRAWRRRYGSEYEALLLDTRAGVGSIANVVWSAIEERVRSLGRVDEQPGLLQSWAVRAPWAIFTVAPLAFLAVCYLLALAILWSGWRLFLPQLDSPFVNIHGWAIPYFGMGKTLFLGAPVLGGWWILLASRRLTNASWSVIGLVLLTVVGALASVHASRTVVPAGLGHVRFTLEPGTSRVALESESVHAVIILAGYALPWILWKLRPRSFR